MKSSNFIRYFILGILVLGLSISTAFAWESNAKKLFEDDDYEKVIDIAKDHKNDKTSKLGLMLLTFSHLQNYELNNTKSDRTQYKNYLEILEDKVTVTHLDNIRYFTELADKPVVVKIAQKLLKQAFKNISQASDIPRLISFVESDNKKTRKLAIDTIKRLVKPKRKYILKGGTLRDEDIVAMQDKALIKALLAQASESAARATLVLIERPVLAYIGGYEGKQISKIEKNINKAIVKREKKFPKSLWYSATGKAKSTAMAFDQ